jgi:hypothetical protein
MEGRVGGPIGLITRRVVASTAMHRKWWKDCNANNQKSSHKTGS